MKTVKEVGIKAVKATVAAGAGALVCIVHVYAGAIDGILRGVDAGIETATKIMNKVYEE